MEQAFIFTRTIGREKYVTSEVPHLTDACRGLKAGFNPTFHVNPIAKTPTNSIMSTRNTTTTSATGDPYGTAWDDNVRIPDLKTTAITHIVLTYDDGSYIRSLTVHFNNKAGEMRGGTGSSQVDIILTAGEFITEVEGKTGDGVMTKIAFRTNKGI